MGTNMRQAIKCIGIIFFIYILTTLDYDLLAKALAKINWLFLALSCLLSLVAALTKAMRWKLLVNGQAGTITLFRCYVLTLFLGFVATVTPLRIGELLKLEHLRNAGLNTARGAVNIIMDRGMELLVMLLISFAVVLYNLPLAIGAGLMIAVLVLAMLLLFFSKGGWRILLDLLPEDKATGIEQLPAEWLKMSWHYYVPAALISIMSVVVVQYQIWLIAVGLQANLGFWVFFQAMLIANIVAMVPITIAGLGTREFILISLLARQGVPAELAALISILDLVLVCLVFRGAVALAIWSFKNKLLTEPTE
ncbi:lysylphosphatidylglycerol synthase transmembrane domain-containing protein [Thermodesulfobacteriota bacterium]